MSEAINEKISKAIHDCLLRCCISSSPLASLAKFIEELRSNPLWHEPEIARVERGVKESLEAAFRRPPQNNSR
jgi:hypothetical protein